mmetsp:Transcript_13129/g.26204  ORF Transcript_13129/g.26204 Transcript_13129/m.26204 type:complete len:103 (-) Transcript_13129:94-402(-)
MSAAWKSALSRNLQELRLLVSTTSPGSKGLREFVENSYLELKKSNPLFPILVREKTDVDATVIARYEYGVEQAVRVEGMDQGQVAKAVQGLVEQGQQESSSS